MSTSGIAISGLCVDGYLAATSYTAGYRAITIDHTKIGSTDLTDYPLLFTGSYLWLRTVANGGAVTSSSGYDICFYSDSALTTMLKFERVYWSASLGQCEFYVKVPTVSHTVDTVIYIAYGNSSITTEQQDAVNVYDANFKRVFHLSDNAANTTVVDSTTLGNGTSAANTSSKTTPGKISSALTFNGTSDSVTGFSTPFTGTGDWTISCWLNNSSTGVRKALVEFGSGTSNNDAPHMYAGSDNKLHLDMTNVGGPSSAATVSDGTWHLCHMVNNAGTVQAYVDGSASGSSVGMSPNITSGTRNNIGMSNYSGSDRDWWSGALDEVRISNVARSGDWITSEYNNQNSPSTFYSIGTVTAFTTRRRIFITMSN